MRVTIIDCGAGNLHSVRKAVAAHLPADAQLHVTTRAEDLAAATHIILPGVGAFADCMQGLAALTGMRAALEEAVLRKGTPFLGICVGMQMLFERGHEHGVHEGLGWFKGEVMPLAPADPTLKIPHMGWNRLQRKHVSDVLDPIFCDPLGAEVAPYVYFVHSYAVQGAKGEEILATAEYGGEVVAAIGRGNILGVQFHPEKSQRVGLALIEGFLHTGT